MNDDTTTRYIRWHHDTPTEFHNTTNAIGEILRTTAAHNEAGDITSITAVVIATSSADAIAQAKALWTERYGWQEPELPWWHVTDRDVDDLPGDGYIFEVSVSQSPDGVKARAWIQAATADDARRIAREKAHALVDEAFGEGVQV